MDTEVVDMTPRCCDGYAQLCNTYHGRLEAGFDDRYDSFKKDIISKGFSEEEFLKIYLSYHKIRDLFEWHEIHKFMSEMACDHNVPGYSRPKE